MDELIKLGFNKVNDSYERGLNYLNGYAETLSVSKDGLKYLVFYSKYKRGSTTIEEFNPNTIEDVISLYDSLQLN